jgi:hypothetical protein
MKTIGLMNIVIVMIVKKTEKIKKNILVMIVKKTE